MSPRDPVNAIGAKPTRADGFSAGCPLRVTMLAMLALHGSGWEHCAVDSALWGGAVGVDTQKSPQLGLLDDTP